MKERTLPMEMMKFWNRVPRSVRNGCGSVGVSSWPLSSAFWQISFHVLSSRKSVGCSSRNAKHGM